MRELLMKKDVINAADIENKFSNTERKCGVVTCIHCVGNKCTNEICEIYERSLCQEG